MQNWDIVVLLPILFITCFAVIGFVIYKEKIKHSAGFFLLGILVFWIFASLVGYQLSKGLNYMASDLSPTTYILLILLSSSIFTIFLKPLATFYTGVIRMRKFWTCLSYSGLILTSIILLTVKIDLYTFTILSILYSLLLSTSTIHNLLLNEQFYYRINTLPVTWICYTFIGVGSILGVYFGDIQTVIFKNFNFTIFNSLAIVVGIILLVFSVINKENKNLAGVFDSDVIDQLPKKSNWNFLAIYTIVLLLSLSYSLANSILITDFLSLKLWEIYKNSEAANLWVRISGYATVIPSLLVSYFIYKYLMKYFGQKYLFMINLFLLFFAYTILAFVKNPYVFIILNIFIGISFNQLMYSLFSLCMFWNYRAPKNPVTGFYGSSLYLGKFIVEVIEQPLVSQNKSLYGKMPNLSDSYNENLNLNELDQTYGNTVTIIFACCSVIVLFATLIYFYTNAKLMADFTDYRLATQNLKTILKKQIMLKAKTKVDVSNGKIA
ncbi:hypothetical protein SHELI_v1c02380 [Spiroplasma helicoides]|uniref:MFS transporter n=1 Tax=Spiroplasma helicoides TaxID=216938 RepID=A0A1B3SJT3_9MOLU|nr:hypothetical protein [Spiroplasma helicoides]AOG60193.1 hypothetical protein SHELI_v1c02380 [Spiroplasma helicoides]